MGGASLQYGADQLRVLDLGFGLTVFCSNLSTVFRHSHSSYWQCRKQAKEGHNLIPARTHSSVLTRVLLFCRSAAVAHTSFDPTGQAYLACPPRSRTDLWIWHINPNPKPKPENLNLPTEFRLRPNFVFKFRLRAQLSFSSLRTISSSKASEFRLEWEGTKPVPSIYRGLKNQREFEGDVI